jgi:hypothetical protein
MEAEVIMADGSNAHEVPETRAEPAPAAPLAQPIETQPVSGRAPGDTRGFPARPKDAKGDYIGAGRKDPWTGEPLRKLTPQTRRN